MQPIIKAIIKAITKRWQWFLASILVSSITILSIGGMGFWWISQNRILPGVKVGSIPLGGLTRNQAVEIVTDLQASFLTDSKIDLILLPSKIATGSATKNYVIDLNALGVEYSAEKTVEKAYQIGRDQDWVNNLKTRWIAINEGINVDHEVIYSQIALGELLNKIALEIDNPGAPAEIKWLEQPKDNIKFEVFAGTNGWRLDKQQAGLSLYTNLLTLNPDPINAELVVEKK